jgi:hypothetical protein
MARARLAPFLSFLLKSERARRAAQSTRPLLARAAHLSRDDDRRAGDGSRLFRAGWVTRVIGERRGNKVRLLGWCLVCWANFVVDVATLVAKRGRDCLLAGMAPVPCPAGARSTGLYRR